MFLFIYNHSLLNAQVRFNMNKNNFYKNKISGFTLIETMVAIFVLSTSIISLLALTSSSSNMAKYGNNEITANYLLQEAIDSIRNSRDSIAFQQKELGGGWSNFLLKYGDSNTKTKCFSSNGCYVVLDNFNPGDFITGNDVTVCPSSGCPLLKINKDGQNSFYNYSSSENSIFKRIIKMELVNVYELKVEVRVDWSNTSGSNRSRTMTTYLLDWQQ